MRSSLMKNISTRPYITKGVCLVLCGQDFTSELSGSDHECGPTDLGRETYFNSFIIAVTISVIILLDQNVIGRVWFT